VATMSDDPETVYVTSSYNRSSTKRRPIHLERDCRALAQAESVLEKPRDAFGEARRVCQYCTGEQDPADNYNTEIRSIIADPDFDPTELGLSPLRDGGGSA